MLSPSIRYPFINQLTGPKGFWSHAGHVSFCKRIPAEMRSVVDCGPSDLNGATLCSDSVVPGPGVRILGQRSALISGNVGSLDGSACATVLAHVDTRPDSLIPSRIAALSTRYAIQHMTISEIIPTAVENKNARPIASLNVASIVSPVVEGPIIHIRKSNLDLNGHPVKRGRLVSWGGLRFKVLRIEGGRAYYGDSFSNSVACGLVQVVA